MLRVRSRKAPVQVYDVAEITYDVIPSSATINKLNSDLRNYITTNNTADKFIAEVDTVTEEKEKEIMTV